MASVANGRRGFAGWLDGLYVGWIVAALGFWVAFTVFGTRFAMGLFVPELTVAFDRPVATVSLVFAISTLVAGLSQPVLGMLADRYGATRILVGGVTLMGASYAGTGFATQFWLVMALLGVGTGIAMSGSNLVVISAWINRWFEKHKGRALGLCFSGNRLGSLVVVPATAAIITTFGWRAALVCLGVLMISSVPALLRFRYEGPEALGMGPDGVRIPQPNEPETHADVASDTMTDVTVLPSPPGPEGLTVRQAFRTRACWLLMLALFSNGFTVNLLLVHIPNFVINMGYDLLLATTILTLMALVGFAGNILVGVLSDTFKRKHVLMLVFASRALVTTLMVAMPGIVTLYMFAIVNGVLGFGAGTVLANATADIFGRAQLATIFGFMFVAHQIGGAIGAYSGGLSFDYTGSYDAAFIAAVAIAVAAAILILFAPNGRISAKDVAP